VGVKFDPASQLQVRNPKNMLAVGSYSQVSMYFKTNGTNGLLFYLGPNVGPRIVRMTTVIHSAHVLVARLEHAVCMCVNSTLKAVRRLDSVAEELNSNG